MSAKYDSLSGTPCEFKSNQHSPVLRYNQGRTRPRNRAGRQIQNERAMRDAICGFHNLSQVQVAWLGKAQGKGKSKHHTVD